VCWCSLRRWVPGGTKSTTACITLLHVAAKIILADFNMAVSTLTAKPPNFIHVKFSGYTVTPTCYYRNKGEVENMSVCMCVYVCMKSSVSNEYWELKIIPSLSPANPLVCWPHSTGGVAVTNVQWAVHQPGVFLVQDCWSNIYLWWVA